MIHHVSQRAKALSSFFCTRAPLCQTGSLTLCTDARIRDVQIVFVSAYLVIAFFFPIDSPSTSELPVAHVSKPFNSGWLGTLILLSLIGAILQLPLQARPTGQLFGSLFGDFPVVVHISTHESAWSMHHICFPLFFFWRGFGANVAYSDDPRPNVQRDSYSKAFFGYLPVMV